MRDFLANLPKLPTPDEMRQWDAAAVEFGMPSSLLMENAGREIFLFLKSEFADLAQKAVALFMGPGANGGDAACVARHLADLGIKPVVFHTASLDASKGATAWEIGLARANGVVFEPIASEHMECLGAYYFLERFKSISGKKPDILVDGLMGTGFGGELKPFMLAVVENFNTLAKTCSAWTLSIDIPSGLNGLSGKPSPIAARANATVTLAAAKTGLLMPDAREYTGRLYVRGIGLPRAIEEKCPASMALLDGSSLFEKEDYPRESYKNMYGHVYVIGGAKGLSGAAHMACAAALRAGAGLVTACAPAGGCPQIKNGWPEIMTFSLCAGEEWPEDLPGDFAEDISKAGALIVGPGMGRGPDSANFIRKLLELPNRPPTVFDADALIIMGRERELLEQLREDDILTPHPGEAAALLGIQAKDAQADRVGAMKSLCGISKAALILKGAFTLVSQKDEKVLLCPYDIPQLAIGGAGDVLSGLCGALLARREAFSGKALACAGLAAISHVVAGRMLAEKYPERGGLASDLANAIPHVRAFILERAGGEKERGILPWP